MYSANARKSFGKKRSPRQKYSGHFLFATKEGLCEGKLENFSRNGLFNKTRKPLPIGETFTYAIPYSKNINYKRQGAIVWRNKKGFRVNLLEESNYKLAMVRPLKF